MTFLTRKGFLIEEQGMSYLADTDPDRGLGSLQAAACTYRIALGPRVSRCSRSRRAAAKARSRLDRPRAHHGLGAPGFRPDGQSPVLDRLRLA